MQNKCVIEIKKMISFRDNYKNETRTSETKQYAHCLKDTKKNEREHNII